MADRQELAFLKYALGVTGANPQEQTALENLLFTRLLTGGITVSSAGVISGGGLATTLNSLTFFLVAGQSNAQGQGVAATSVTVPTGKVLQFYNGAFTDANDPVGNANTGSAWPAFGLSYFNATGRKVCFVPTAIAGSAQLAAADTGNGNWDAAGALYGLSVTALTTAFAAAVAAGYAPTYGGVLWSQGETDADGINASTAGVTQANYQAALIAMIARYRVTFGTNLPFYIFATGTKTGGSDTGYGQVRAAQRNVRDADAQTQIVFENAYDYQWRSLMQVDHYHYTQPGYNEMGRIGASNVLGGQARTFFQHTNSGTTDLYFTAGKLGIGIAPTTAGASFPNYQLQTRVAADENFCVLPHQALANGICLFSVDDAISAQKGIEFRGSDIAFTTNSIVRLTIANGGTLTTGLGSALALSGATSGSVTLAVPAIAGANTLTLPAGTTDFSTTGGAGKFVKQATAGAALTVVQPATTDLSDITTPTNVTFSAGNFTADVGNWTLTAPDQTTFTYSITGKLMTVWWVLDTTTLSSTPTVLRIAIPASKTCLSRVVFSHWYNNGSWAQGYGFIAASGTVISLQKDPPASAFSAGTDTVYTYGSVTFPTT